MFRPPPTSTLTAPPFPNPPLFLSDPFLPAGAPDSAIRPGPPDAACRVCRGAAPGPLAVLDGKSYLWCARCEATLMAWADLPDAAAEEAQERLHRHNAAEDRKSTRLNSSH